MMAAGDHENEWHPELVFLHVVDEVKDIVPEKLRVRPLLQQLDRGEGSRGGHSRARGGASG